MFPTKTSTLEQNLYVRIRASHKDAFAPPCSLQRVSVRWAARVGIFLEMAQWSFLSFSANHPKSTNPAFSQRFLQCFSPFWHIKRRLSALICHQEHQLCHFAMACFLRNVFINTHTTTVLSTLTSRLQRLKAMNGAAVLLRFCVQLGSNYFNYTVAAFSADVWLILTLLNIIHFRLCPNQQIKSSQAQFVNLSYFQVGHFFFSNRSFPGRRLLRLVAA